MSSKIPAIFKNYAQRFFVDDAAFSVLESRNINTLDAFFFNIPNESALERFLANQILPAMTSMTDTTLEDWLCSASAGSLRRLWECAKIVARRDLEDEISLRVSVVPRKLQAVVLQDMFARATWEGMAQPLSRHLPGPLTLTKVVDNLSVNGACIWIDWTNYVSRDDEDAATRLGSGAATLGLSIVHDVQTGILMGVQDQPDIRRFDPMDLETFRDVMTLRGVAHHIAGLVTVEVYNRLTEIYDEALTMRVAELYRPPTLGEVKKVDRDLHEDIFYHVSAGQGTLHDALVWYTGRGKASCTFFAMLQPVPEMQPDRSAERAPLAKVVCASPLTGKVCWLCSKPLSSHASGRFCKPRQVTGRMRALYDCWSCWKPMSWHEKGEPYTGPPSSCVPCEPESIRDHVTTTPRARQMTARPAGGDVPSAAGGTVVAEASSSTGNLKDLVVVNPASVNPTTVNPAMVSLSGESPGGPHLPHVLWLPPARDPWDYLIDKTKNVIHNHATLVEEVRSSELQHWGPNCGTFTRARDILIPGVKNAPPPLRNNCFPEGLPAILNRAGPADGDRTRQRVIDDTFMADLAAEECLRTHRAGFGFSLEHPGRSIALELPSWKRLREERGVFALFHHHCRFKPCKKRKYQVVITNILELIPRIERVCKSPKLCDRTGEPHDPWAKVIENGFVKSFGTTGTAEYPTEFCEQMAMGYIEWLKKRGSCRRQFSFVEIFAGARAPLTVAVTAQLALFNKPPVASLEIKTPRPWLAPKELSRYQRADLAAGRQPKWSSASQLVRDGIQDPVRHLEAALKLGHPGTDDEELSFELQCSVDEVARAGLELTHRRIQIINYYEQLAKDLETERADLVENQAGYTFKAMSSPLNIPLMEKAGDYVAIEDSALPRKLLAGLPIVGPADTSPFFTDFVVPAKISIGDLLLGAPARRKCIVAKVMADAKRNKSVLLEAVAHKTMKEVELKQMGPPMTSAEVTSKFGNLWNVAQRYGIEQGVDDAGLPKYRCIDNHADNANNDAAERRQTVPMASVAAIMLTIRAMFCAVPMHLRGLPDWQICGATEDMRAAYRQCPLLSSQVGVAITAVFHPALASVRFHEMWGQPFGAGHAVPNFYRMAEWACRVARRLLFLVCDHFFDDFWIIEPKCTIASAVWAFNRIMGLFGFQLDPGKQQLPAQVWHALGVEFDLRGLVASGKLFVQALARRLYNTAMAIVAVVNADRLRPAHAAKLFGRLDFLNTTLFGRVGRAGLAHLKERQYASDSTGEWRLSKALRGALLWVLELLLVAPPRELPMDSHYDRPCLLYTDGSSDPNRTPQHYVGAVLFDPRRQHPQYTHCAVPDVVVERWLPAKQHIHLVELFAGPLALDTWLDVLRDRLVIHFVDNSAALGALVKGYSPSGDMLHLAGDHWLRWAHLRAFIYVDRVESKSNVSDEPSRPDVPNTVLDKLGAEFVDPCLTYLKHHSDRERPSSWLGDATRRTAVLEALATKFTHTPHRTT